MMGGTCICGASKGCDGQHHCPSESSWTVLQLAAKSREVEELKSLLGEAADRLGALHGEGPRDLFARIRAKIGGGA